ncbi:MAG: hypothetical protein ABII00_02625, partial [Elusimicrobiota bacterium]
VEVRVVVTKTHWTQMIPLESSRADVVFLGLGVPEEGGEAALIGLYEPLLDRLRTTILVHSAEKLDVTI